MSKRPVKYSDEELSRILSCSAAGVLGFPGPGDTVCVEQAARGSLESYKDRFENYTPFDDARLAPRTKNGLPQSKLRDPDAMMDWLIRNGYADATESE